jgi:hypothetical protein
MSLKCPYCECEYDISIESLPKPLGDEKLGYGWWVRCSKCQKKWWVRSSVMQAESQPSNQTRLSAARNQKISRLQEANKKCKRKIREEKATSISPQIFVLAGLAVLVVFCFINKDLIHQTISKKLMDLSSNLTPNISLHDVQYYLEFPKEDESLEVGPILHVLGSIVNKEKSVAKVKGVKIRVFKNAENPSEKEGGLIDEWTYTPDAPHLTPGALVKFHSEKEIDISGEEAELPENMRVELSVL